MARHFGGVGAMVERPELKLSIREGGQLEAMGQHADRAMPSRDTGPSFTG